MLIIASLLVACQSAQVDVDFDADADGLMNSEEAELGTDPESADSDGDGAADADELLGNTDPVDAGDKPYQLGWPIDACRDDVQGTGFGEGETVPPTALIDQLDETVHTNDFCDQVVLLDFSAGWCGACQAEAPLLESFYEEHKEEGFLAITVFMENLDGSAPSLEETKAWASDYGLSFPVLQDDGSFYNSFAVATGSSSIGLPLMVLVDRGMVVSISEGATEEDVLELLGEGGSVGVDED